MQMVDLQKTTIQRMLIEQVKTRFEVAVQASDIETIKLLLKKVENELDDISDLYAYMQSISHSRMKKYASEKETT